MPTLWQSPGQVRNKGMTQIIKVRDTNHVTDFHDSCPQQVRDFVMNLSRTLLQTLSPTFPVHCNGLNSIRATHTGLLQTCHGFCRKHLDMSKWFVSVTFMICVGDFHRNFMVSWFVTICDHNFHDLCPRISLGEVSVKVGVMEFGLNRCVSSFCSVACRLIVLNLLHNLLCCCRWVPLAFHRLLVLYY